MKAMDKVMMFANKMGNNPYLQAISRGLMATLPINILGSISLLLAVLPIDLWSNFLNTIGLTPYLFTTFSLTVGIIAVYGAFFIGYQLAKNLGQAALPGGLVSLFTFLLMTPMVASEAGGMTLDSSRLGAQGIFTAIIAGLIFTKIYCIILDKKIVIKMPDGVPPFVSETFAGLLPVILTSIIAIIVARLFGATTWGSFADFINAIVATPLQGLSSHVGSLLFIVLVQMLLWFFGIHGSMVVGPFVAALFLPMDLANMDALAAGYANSDFPNIMGQTFYNIFSGIGGAGGTLSLIIVILIFAKSKQNRAVGKLATVPGMFTINEPMVFGLPLLLNPIMAVPFILTPLVQTGIAYLGIASGLFPRLSGVAVPFGTPIFVNGFIAGGWSIPILQLICVAAGCLLYYPFLKVLDKQKVKEESETTEVAA